MPAQESRAYHAFALIKTEYPVGQVDWRKCRSQKKVDGVDGREKKFQ